MKPEDYIRSLKEAPIEPKSVAGYKIWEPETGWPEDIMEIVLEMLKRGYDIVIIPRKY